MRRWRFIKEKKKERFPTYQGEAILKIISKEKIDSVQPEVSIAGTDVTVSDRNKTLSPSISYSTNVA
jgi:hypothetical protein